MGNGLKWIEGLKPEELPPLYQEMASLVGLENTLRLAEHFGKQGVYFSGLDDVIRRKKEEYIRKNFNGVNHKELARLTGYSERWVYVIIEQDRQDKRQMRIFE